MFETKISAGGKEIRLDISSWSYDMESHAMKCVERYCELANRTTQQLYKVATPCLDSRWFGWEVGSVGELSKVCSQIVRICLYLAWSVNKLLRAVTTWTSACDKRLARLISYTCHTSEWMQTVSSCGKHCTTLQVGTLSRLEIDLRRTFVHIWKSYTRTNKLDVQETNISLTQFNGSWDYFSWCRFTHGWDSSSRSLGFGYWSVPFFP